MSRRSGDHRRPALAGLILLLVLAAAVAWRLLPDRKPLLVPSDSEAPGPKTIPPPAVLEAARRIDRKKEAARAAGEAGARSRAASLEELRIEAAGLHPDPEEAAEYFAHGLLGLATRNPTELRRLLEDGAFPARERILASFLPLWDAETFDTPAEEPASLLESLGRLAEQSPTDAVAILAALPEGDLREVLAFEIAEVWWDLDPAAARSWVEGLSGSADGAMAASAVAEQWAHEDAPAAAAWSAGLADPEGRIAGLGAVLDHWVGKSPEESLPWFRERIAPESPEFAELAPLVAEAWAATDQAGAFAWVADLPADGTRDEALRAAVLGGIAGDPSGTFSLLRDWSGQATPPVSGLPDLAHLALSDWARRDPIAAAGQLRTLPSSRFRDEAVLGFATVHAEADPEAALEWVLSVSGESLRGEGIDIVVQTWVEDSRREPAARDLENFARDLETEGRSGEAELVRERSRAILFPSDE